MIQEWNVYVSKQVLNLFIWTNEKALWLRVHYNSMWHRHVSLLQYIIFNFRKEQWVVFQNDVKNELFWRSNSFTNILTRILKSWKRSMRYLICDKYLWKITYNLSNPLTLIRLGTVETAPWYILLYGFLVTHPNFMKFGDFS